MEKYLGGLKCQMGHFITFFHCLIYTVRLLIMYFKRSENSVDMLTKGISV